MVLCEGLVSAGNVQVLAISSRALSFITECLADLGLSSELVPLSLKHVNQLCATRSLTVPGPSISFALIFRPSYYG